MQLHPTRVVPRRSRYFAPAANQPVFFFLRPQHSDCAPWFLLPFAIHSYMLPFDFSAVVRSHRERHLKFQMKGRSGHSPVRSLSHSVIGDWTLEAPGAFTAMAEKQKTVRLTLTVLVPSVQLEVRLIPNFCILYTSEVRFRPSLAAAPLGPPTTQLLSSRARTMCSRSAWTSELAVGLDFSARGRFLASGIARGFHHLGGNGFNSLVESACVLTSKMPHKLLPRSISL